MTIEGDPAGVVQQFLRPGERLVWSGRPDPDVTFGSADVFLVPFSVLWGGFAIFWELSVLASGGAANLFFVLWGIPFVVAGAYFMVGRFFYKRWDKRRTVYALTPDRALVVVGGTSTREAPITGSPQTVRRRDGHASVTVGSPGPWFAGGLYANTGMDFFMRGSGAVGFYDVSDGDALLAALDQVRTTPRP